MTWKLGCSTLACPGWTLEQVVDLARRSGYEGLELRLVDGELIDPSLSQEARAEIDRRLQASGLAVVAVDSSIRLLDDRPEADVVADIRAFLVLAAGWSAPLVRVFGGTAPEGMTAGAAEARAAGVLNAAAADAARLGVRIGIETHDAFSAAAAVAPVLALVDSPQVGVVWDLLHTHRMGETPEQVWELVGPRIFDVHVKDARRAADGSGWPLVLLGEGEVPVAAVLDVLRRGGYEGWLVAEWEKRWHPEIEEPDVALPHEAAVLRDWIAAPA
jgi:sugar phosphate isomerase/epimerase